MQNWRFLAFVTLVALAPPCVLSAQSFEGTITQRTIEVDEQALFDLFLAEGDDQEFEKEDDWIRHTAQRLFDFPLDQLNNADGVDVQDVTMWIKGSKIRYGMSEMGEDTYMIVDAASKTTWMVTPSQRSYVKFTAEGMESAAEDAAKLAEDMMAKMGIDPEDIEQNEEEYADEEYEEEGVFTGFEPGVRALERTEDVNGIKATAHEAVAGYEIAVGWCADDGFGLMGTMEALVELAGFNEEDEDEYDTGPSAGELLCEGKIPVRTQLFSAGSWGQTYTVDEIVAIEQTPVSDDRFEIPSDYTEKKLSDIWG
jgi:hypothetical protein